MRVILATLACLCFGSWVCAQTATPARMSWQNGQVISYRVEQTTHASDSIGETTNETKSILKVVRRWKVTQVDTNGVATLEMSLASMYQERTTPNGDVLTFDSANLEKSTPALKDVMKKFVGTTLATVRVDSLGKVVEVKSSTTDATSYENELPFLLLLPATGLQAGKGWDRAYKITLAPPLGTGEKYDAVQSFHCKAIKDGLATIALTTTLKSAPRAAADAVPMWQMMPEGEIVFDVKSGRLNSAKLSVSKELKGHQGESSACKFTSSLSVQLER